MWSREWAVKIWNRCECDHGVRTFFAPFLAGVGGGVGGGTGRKPDVHAGSGGACPSTGCAFRMHVRAGSLSCAAVYTSHDTHRVSDAHSAQQACASAWGPPPATVTLRYACCRGHRHTPGRTSQPAGHSDVVVVVAVAVAASASVRAKPRARILISEEGMASILARIRPCMAVCMAVYNCVYDRGYGRVCGRVWPCVWPCG